MNNQLDESYETAIETLLRRTIGLEANSIGSKVIAGAVHLRRIALKLPNLSAYYHHLLASPPELETLIEGVVVSETWFFRDREPFNYLGQYIRAEGLVTPYPKVWRMLSAPCATGEEPYSIAITLLEAGLPTTNFQIDALDISRLALNKAHQRVYNSNSFRGTDNTFRDRYFETTPEGYKLSEAIANTVHFQQNNLLEMTLPSRQELYDVIFCRNVLIYFDTIARTKTIQSLHYLLKPQGLLFVGHSETGEISTSPKFKAIAYPHTFAYQKIRVPASLNPPCLPQPNSLKIYPPKTPPALPKAKPKDISLAPTQEKRRPENSSTYTPENPQKTLKSALENARELADRGQIVTAINLCETYLQQNRSSADAYYLLGELHQAQGQLAQAEKNFEKSIYLNPHLEEALVHLALIKEQQGDLARAEVIWQRIQRLQK